MSDNLAQDVMDEVLDPKYDEMTHGHKGTYAVGCRGPLCRKSERDACAARYRNRANREVKAYRPRKNAYPEEWLQEMIDWHKSERAKIGKFRSLREFYGLKEQEENNPVMATTQ